MVEKRTRTEFAGVPNNHTLWKHEWSWHNCGVGVWDKMVKKYMGEKDKRDFETLALETQMKGGSSNAGASGQYDSLKARYDHCSEVRRQQCRRKVDQWPPRNG